MLCHHWLQCYPRTKKVLWWSFSILPGRNMMHSGLSRGSIVFIVVFSSTPQFSDEFSLKNYALWKGKASSVIATKEENGPNFVSWTEFQRVAPLCMCLYCKEVNESWWWVWALHCYQSQFTSVTPPSLRENSLPAKHRDAVTFASKPLLWNKGHTPWNVIGPFLVSSRRQVGEKCNGETTAPH